MMTTIYFSNNKLSIKSDLASELFHTKDNEYTYIIVRNKFGMHSLICHSFFENPDDIWEAEFISIIRVDKVNDIKNEFNEETWIRLQKVIFELI